MNTLEFYTGHLLLFFHGPILNTEYKMLPKDTFSVSHHYAEHHTAV